MRSIIGNLHDFTERYIGDSQPGVPGEFLVNNQGVVGNSLHVELGRGGYLPTNAATSESQILMAQGYLEAYRATRTQEYLDKAIYYAEAYVRHYMLNGAYSEPTQVGEFRSHWALNGKDPFVSWGPINFKDYQESGALDALMTFTNGEGIAPGGEPWYGEKLRRAYFAFGPDPSVPGQVWEDVNLVWQNIFSGVRVGKEYLLESFADVDGIVWTVADNRDATQRFDLPMQPPGWIKLRENFTGDLKVVFASEAGFTIGRNQGFDAWPMWRALERGESNSAMDAELWHTELFRDLYDITQNEKWLRYYTSTIFSLDEASRIDPPTVFFEQNPLVRNPMNVGISFNYFIGDLSQGPVYRDDEGYIRADKAGELFQEAVSAVVMDQIGVTVEVFPYSNLRLDWAGSGREAYLEVQLKVEAEIGSGQVSKFRASRLFADNLDSIERDRLRMDEFLQSERPDGTSFAVARGASVIGFGEYDMELKQGIIFENQDLYTRCSIGGFASGIIFGFWASEPQQRPLPNNLTYRVTAGDWYVRVSDADGWLWWRMLPKGASGEWMDVALDWADFVPSEFQANEGVPPANPNPILVPQLEFVPPTTVPFELVSQIDLYAFAGRPEPMQGETNFVRELSLGAYDWRPLSLKVGQVEIENPAPTEFKYAPGAVPFTFDKQMTTGQKYWRGSPYLAYQYPSVWADAGQFDRMNQVIDFYRDAQNAYTDRFGIVGPFAPVFYWPKWDNLDFGQPNSFGWTGPDPNTFWGGFQGRVFHAAAHLWATLVKLGEPVPQDLVDTVENYATWLLGFMDDNNEMAPTDFPADELPRAGYEEPHMVGLNLAAGCYMANAGSPLGAEVRDRCFGKLMTTFQVSGDMRGSFSTDPDNKLFFGFWVGEIMRALALYFQQDVEGFGPFVAPAPFPVIDAEMGLEDGEGEAVILHEDGTPIRFNEIPLRIVFAIATEQGDLFTLEDSDNLLTLE